MSSLTYTSEVSRGAWIRPRLGGWHLMGGLVPQGYDAYVRIFHPGDAQFLHWADGACVTEAERVLRWQDLAALRGLVFHPLMQWLVVFGEQQNPVYGQDGWQYQNPRLGSLPQEQFVQLTAILASHTLSPSECTAGLWDGYGSSSWLGPTLDLPNRSYDLFEAPLETFADSLWTERNGWTPDQTPNLLWPGDHSWFLCSEIDFDSTVIGGSRELIDSVLALESIEALEIPANASLASDADTINPTPA